MAKNKRFKRLYLHIGLGKTGSTSIQKDLLSKTRLLETKYNLHYPRNFSHELSFRGNHSILLRVLFSDFPDTRQRLVARGLKDEKSIEAYNQKTLTALEKSFRSSSAQNLMFSAEGVAHFRKDEMIKLAAWLDEIADEIKVVACLRHPVQALSSEIQQRLKIGDVLEDLYKRPPYYSFRPLLERVEIAFGRENIIAYSFADATKNDAGLVTELFSGIGIDTGNDFTKSPPYNTSMSHEAALLISALNRLHPVLLDGKRNPIRKVNDIQKLIKIPGRKYTAPRLVYERVMENIQPDVEWLKEKYGIDLSGEAAEQNRPYYSFTPESIDSIVLKISECSRIKYAILSPIRFFILYLRHIRSRIF
jgi:hypothetical protein